MGDSFVSRKDRIIASAIEIISESGLAALTTKNLALKENMSDALLYKYFGGINEVLVEVVETYSKFDKGIRQTVQSKNISNVDKLIEYFDAYATYYDSYYAISTLMLQYEELLHIVETREKIAWCITERLAFLEGLFQKAIDEKEISDTMSASVLANNATGMVMSHILERRISYHKKSFKDEYMDNFRKWMDLLRIKKSSK
ncbi:MAG: TetR/AcrR family transcriptional regulator [Wujia sp.]